jgi:hypothetical protein
LPFQSGGNTNDTHSAVVHTRAKRAGIGNRVMQEMVGSLVGILMHRAASVVCRLPTIESFELWNDYEYPPSEILRSRPKACVREADRVEVRSDGGT